MKIGMLQNKYSQIIYSLLFSFLLIQYSNIVYSYPFYVGIAGLVGFILFIVIVFKFTSLFWRGSSVQEIVLSLLIVTAFLGGGFSLVSIAGFSLFPYRLFFLLLILIYAFNMIKGKNAMIWGNIRIKPIILFLYFWCCYAVISLSWVESFSEGIKEIIFIFIGIMIIYFVITTFNSKAKYFEFFMIWNLMTIVLILIGFGNHFFSKHLPISRINYAYSNQQSIPTAVFVNENDYASFLAISLFFLVSLIHHHQLKVMKFVGVLGVIGSLYLIVITDSRANYLSVGFGFIFWFLFMINSRLRKKVLVGLGTVLFMIFNERFISLINKIYTQISLLLIPNESSHSVDIRKNLLRNIKVFVEDTFGFGIGAGNAEVYMEKYQVYDTRDDFNVHNWWAEILVHYGAIVFLFYILMIVYLFVKIFQNQLSQSDQTLKMINESILCGIVVFIFASTSPNSFMALTYNWLFVAFAIGLVQYYKSIKMEDRGVERWKG